MLMNPKMLDSARQMLNENLKKNIMLTRSIMLCGGEFLNPRQKKVATKFLLNNDEFVKAAQELADKTEEIVAIVPGSAQSPGVSMQIFKWPKMPFDFHFAKDKNGQLIFDSISEGEYPTTNSDAVKNFINLVKKYINKEI